MCAGTLDAAFCSLYSYGLLQFLLSFADPVELAGEPLLSSDAPNSVKLFRSGKRIGEVLSFPCYKNAALEPILMVLCSLSVWRKKRLR